MITTKNDIIVPEIMSRLMNERIGRSMRLLPLASLDRSLEGRPGDTLSFPFFKQIGVAKKVLENGEVERTKMSQEMTSVTVEKYANGISLTDEALLSGYGDPLDEAISLLSRSIDAALDDELYKTLEKASLSRRFFAPALSSECVSDALSLFGEELEGDKVLLISPRDFARLRKDANYIRASDMGQKMILSGTVGSIWGCQIVVSSKLQDRAYIVKPGALRLLVKKDTRLDVEREPKFMRTNIFASKHACCYLYDESRLISISLSKDMLKLNEGLINIENDGSTLKVSINEALPLGFKLMYKLSDSESDSFSLSGFSDLSAGDEIPRNGKSHIHIALVREGKAYMGASIKL